LRRGDQRRNLDHYESAWRSIQLTSLAIAEMLTLGVILLVGAIALMLAEAHLSTGGVVGTVGTAAAIGGLALLLNAAGLGPVGILIVAAGLAAVATTALLLMRRRIAVARRARPRTGREALVGHIGEVRSASDDNMHVFVEGALWRAEPGPLHADGALHAGDRVVVEHVDGLTLWVRKAEEWELVR